MIYLMFILSFLFLHIASICNSIMDKITHHWYICVFDNPKFPKQWWNPEISWNNKYSKEPKWYYKFVQTSDAWHLFKTLMIIFICLVPLPLLNCKEAEIEWYDYLILFAGYGLTWNYSFSLYYNDILEKKWEKK